MEKKLNTFIAAATAAFTSYWIIQRERRYGLKLLKIKRDFENRQKSIDYHKGWMKGYIAGNKEFKEYLKENYPELLKQIES